MKSQELFDTVVCPLNCQYGSPMGRTSFDDRKDKTKTERFYDRAVQLDSGGYDKGGAYWGLPNNLRVSYNKDLTSVMFYRSKKGKW